jgi:hypothetical protein
MKKLVLAICMMLVFYGIGYAQVLNLNSAETLSVPTATKIELRNINIDVTRKTITVTYRFLNDNSKPIQTIESGAVDRTWRCWDADAVPAFDPLTCTGAGVPNRCCTGAGTGTGCFEGTAAITCFTDTFSFVIRTQDAGTPIGKGLRALIWSKMRPDVLTGANNATLP